MKRLHLDCGMGAAGDMLAAALYELLDDDRKQEFLNIMGSLVPDKVTVAVRPDAKCGILGSHFDVTVNGETEHSHDHHHDDHIHEHTHVREHTHSREDSHEHSHEHFNGHDHSHSHEHTHSHVHHSMSDIAAMIDSFSEVSDDAKSKIMSVYKIIAEAESAVHGSTVSEIHFHEVGMLDAVADVTAVCVLMDMLKPDKVTATPVRVGYGHMRCAHGILPVPAPATARILTGIPTYAGNIEAELCTPTGAALLRHFVTEFGEQPMMKTDRIGYGMGTKDFEVCNCVRALLGTDI